MTGQGAEGLLVCQPILFDLGDARVDAFVRRFERSYKRRPNWIAAGTYDAMRLALEALKRSGPGRTRILEALRGISGPDIAFHGLSGPLFFDQGGSSRRRFFVGEVHGGGLRAAKPPTVEFTD
jgi:ABC-type branched-subunit amino acid transport system substrate-binding protein